MWHDIRRLLELYDQVGEFDMALTETSDRLGQFSVHEKVVAEKAAARDDAGWTNAIPFPRRPVRT